MFLNPVYLLIPISFGILLLLVSALDFYIRSMNLINLSIEARKNEKRVSRQIELTEIVKD
jgi:hypothetical protein